MRNKNIWIPAALLVLLVLILTGCATTVKLEVQRPPTLNTSGIKRIAIMPFESSSNDSAYRELAEYVTVVASSKTRELNYFTLVDHSEIARLRMNNQSIEAHVDALLIGRITRVSSQDGSQLMRTD
jgi:hypothetical protein